jgi:hypothetical protein
MSDAERDVRDLALLPELASLPVTASRLPPRNELVRGALLEEDVRRDLASASWHDHVHGYGRSSVAAIVAEVARSAHINFIE